MGTLRFEWDRRKAAHNLKQHGVAFPEAQTVFEGEDALLIPDPDHSTDDDRYILLGLSSAVRMLVVVRCERQEGDVFHLISARNAMKPSSRITPIGFGDARAA